MNENDAALSATNPHYGCDGLKPICKPPSSGTDAQCVCATSNDATCMMPESTQCTASGSASSPTDGTCMCGSASICAPASTTPSCLLTSDGQTPTVGAASGTSCQVYPFRFSLILMDLSIILHLKFDALNKRQHFMIFHFSAQERVHRILVM